MHSVSNPTQMSVPRRAMILAGVLSLLGSVGLSIAIGEFSRASIRPPLVSRINPNTADVTALMTLPNIGPARAGAIVEYRQQTYQENPVFRRVEDLQAIKGIGPTISEGLRPWLEFESLLAAAEE